MGEGFATIFMLMAGFILLAALAVIGGIIAVIVLAVRRNRQGLPPFVAPGRRFDETNNWVNDPTNPASPHSPLNPANPASPNFPGNPGNTI